MQDEKGYPPMKKKRSEDLRSHRWFGVEGVWCTNPMVDVGRSLDALSGDALRHRHPEPGHPVEH